MVQEVTRHEEEPVVLLNDHIIKQSSKYLCFCTHISVLPSTLARDTPFCNGQCVKQSHHWSHAENK